MHPNAPSHYCTWPATGCSLCETAQAGDDTFIIVCPESACDDDYSVSKDPFTVSISYTDTWGQVRIRPIAWFEDEKTAVLVRDLLDRNPNFDPRVWAIA